MENYNPYEEPKGSVLLGLLGALLGALMGAAVWAVVGALGYIASIVGFLIAFLASKGYDLLRGRQGKIKVVVLILCVILAVIIGNAGTTLWQLHEVYQEEGVAATLSEQAYFRIMIPLLLEDGDFIAAIAKDTLIGFVFAAIGCFGMLKNSLRPPKKQEAPAPLPPSDAA